MTHIKGFSAEETDVILDSEGRTLRQILIYHISLQREGKWTGKWGQEYHNDNKKIYRKTDIIFNALSPTDNTVKASPEMLRAMVRVKTNPHDRSSMLNWISTVEHVNEADACGLFRWVIGRKSYCIKVQLPLAAKMVDHIAKPS